MHVPKRRYENEVQRYALAARFVAHAVRTDTIRRWTGLSEGRVRELYRAYGGVHVDRPARRRGPPPARPLFFVRTAHMRDEAGALAAICVTLGAIPVTPMPNARREFTNLRNGELLCHAYGMFRSVVGTSRITLEHALMLATMIAQGTQLQIGHCPYCAGTVIVRPLESHSPYVCKQCRLSAAGLKKAAKGTKAVSPPVHVALSDGTQRRDLPHLP